MRIATVKREREEFAKNGRKDPDIIITRERGLKVKTVMVNIFSLSLTLNLFLSIDL